MDKLQEAAKNYKKLINTEYLYTLGTKDKKNVILEFIGCNIEEFTIRERIFFLCNLNDILDKASKETQDLQQVFFHNKWY